MKYYDKSQEYFFGDCRIDFLKLKAEKHVLSEVEGSKTRKRICVKVLKCE